MVDVDDEEHLMTKFAALFELVRASPTIFRPYHQNFVTPEYVFYLAHNHICIFIIRGVNRVCWANVSTKYPPSIFQKLFRFRLEDIPTLLTALKVSFFWDHKPEHFYPML